MIRKLLILLTLCSLGGYGLIRILSPYVRNENVFVAASLDKENRLKNTPAPRLVFVGGSNLALGIDSRRVAAATGYTVTNMGIHAGLGLPFMLNEALHGTQKGDLVVLSIEYFLDEGDNKLLAQLIDVNPRAKQYLSLSWLNEIRLLGQNLQRCMSGLFYKLLRGDATDPIYNRSGFTVEGDLKEHFGKPKPRRIGDDVTFLEMDYSENIQRINAFVKAAKAREAVVVFTFPVFPASAYKRNQKAIQHLAKQYQNKLDCPIINTPATFVLPDQYFFDTVYHLDSLGVQERTTRMIDLLKLRQNILVGSNQ
ncbi:hypothetical protein [Tellurirhabdus bombi]|uniref:hypothetical protein n=1 Tax=Tellurirhabdus bombi TaxID=2907205 RepID=UPI001F338739|nr:hypothetical protein [Tellurirhabdus bombi]